MYQFNDSIRQKMYIDIDNDRYNNRLIKHIIIIRIQLYIQCDKDLELLRGIQLYIQRSQDLELLMDKPSQAMVQLNANEQIHVYLQKFKSQ